MVTMLGWLSVATKRDRGFQRARLKLSPSCGEGSRFSRGKFFVNRKPECRSKFSNDERRSIYGTSCCALPRE